MLKPYHSPRLTGIMQLEESGRRDLLAALFLTVDPSETWLIHQGMQALADTETVCMEQTCHTLMKNPEKLYFCTDLISLSRDLLVAATVLLREQGISLCCSITGVSTEAAVFPRALQFSLLSLIRAGLHGGSNILYATTTVTHAQFCFTVTADRLIGEKELSLSSAIAGLHGGRLLHSDRTAALQFPPKTKPSADPRWRSPGVDGLVNDRFSVVRLGLYSSERGSNSD